MKLGPPSTDERESPVAAEPDRERLLRGVEAGLLLVAVVVLELFRLVEGLVGNGALVCLVVGSAKKLGLTCNLGCCTTSPASSSELRLKSRSTS